MGGVTPAFWLPVGLLFLLVAMPLLAEFLRHPVDAQVRARAPGSFANLPQGRTHYRWAGPERGPVVVCIHGLSTPSYIFAATERSLAAQGNRVLVYDLYGRGYSARLRGAQTVDFFLSQLKALLAKQGVGGPVAVVGYSMGGLIATAFAAEEGARVEALILIAPAGILPMANGWRERLWSAPVVGDWLMRVLGGWALKRELVEHEHGPTVIPDLEDRQAAETRMRGYLPAILSARRHTLSVLVDEDHKALFDRGTPVLSIWGPSDPVVPLAAMGRLAEINPDAHHAQIPGAGHIMPQTHPAQVAEVLADFLSRR